MRDFSELQAIFMNEELTGHLHETVDWMGTAALVVLVPVLLTTTHAAVKNYFMVS